MSDLNKPIEYQVEATAGEAGGELEKIVSILERMEKSISGVTSSLSALRTASAGVPQAFTKLTSNTSRAFDTKRVVEFSKQMVKYKRIAENTGKSHVIDERALADPLKESIKEAERLNKALNNMEPNTPEYEAANAELGRHMQMLSELEERYNNLKAADIKISVDDAQIEQVDENEVRSVQLKGYKTYSEGSIAESLKDVEKGEDVEPIEIKMRATADLAEAQKERARLERAMKVNENNIIKFQAVGDTKSLQREMRKFEANKAAYEEFDTAARGTEAEHVLKTKMDGFAEIKIQNMAELSAAEERIKKLERALKTAEAELKKFAAAGDAVGFDKMQTKITQTTEELNRYRAAVANASNIRVTADNTASLEDVYANMDKLRMKLNQKSFMGKNAFNSAEVRRLQIELTEAEKAALGLRSALGQIDGGSYLAKNAQLTAKGFIQSRFHAARMNAELRKSQHSMLRVTRVLQLMGIRMITRAVLKDLNAGFATLASQFEPFNDAMSRMMDGVTRVRNSLISAFDPLIRVAAPVVEKVLNRIASGFDKMTQAAAAMTGETMYSKLTSEAQDYNETVNDIQNSLAGFDKFNTIGSQTYAGGVKYKTEFEQVPIDEEFLKWKYIGDGLKEVFEGIGDVIEDLVTDFGKLIGLADDEDVFKGVGDWLSNAGKYLQEHKDGVSNLIKSYLALKLITRGVMTGVGAVETGKRVVSAGKTIAGLFTGKAATTAAASAAPAGSLAAGTGALSTLAIPAGVAVTAYAMTKTVTDDLIPQVKTLSGSLKEFAKNQTGEDMGTWDSLKFYFGEVFKGNWSNYDYVPTTTAPSLTESTTVNNSSSTTELNSDGLAQKVTEGVERAMTKVFRDNKGNVNVNVKVVADADQLFRVIVDKNNAQYNRTGRSPLKT